MREMGGFFSIVGSHPILCSSDANRTGDLGRSRERTMAIGPTIFYSSRSFPMPDHIYRFARLKS